MGILKHLRKFGLIAAAAAMFLGAGVANAETSKERVYTKITGEELQQIMQELGYRAQLSTDDYGDPMITSTSGGYKFKVLFYDCEARKGCEALQFWAGFDTEAPGDMRQMNQWNADKRFGKAYIDHENDPIIEMHYNIDGGVTRENIKSTLEWWEQVVGEFATFINF